MRQHAHQHGTQCSDSSLLAPRPHPPLSLSLLSHLNGSKDAYGETALINASVCGRTDIVRELIAADGSVEHLRMQNNNGVTALSLASRVGETAVVRELVAADGSAEHLRMKDKRGRTALVYAVNDEITALLTAAEAAADAGAAAPPPEGKAQEGEEEDEEDDSPPPSQTQGGAKPKKTLPRPAYEGDAGALLEMLYDADITDEEPDITKVRELLDAGITVRYQVCVPCVCVCLYWWYSTDMHE